VRITSVTPQAGFVLKVSTDDGNTGLFDVSPYLSYEAFELLKDPIEFGKVHNGGYYVEWECGADLSADSIEAGLK